jgi:hypothetical protein
MDSSNLDDLGPLIDPDAPTSEQFVRPVDRFRRTAAGTVVAAGLLGLRDVLEARSERDKPAIVSEARERERSDPIQVVLDFDHPERSVAIIRRPHPLAGD